MPETIYGDQLQRILAQPNERENKVEMVGFVLSRVEEGKMSKQEAKSLLGKVGLVSVESLTEQNIKSYSNQELLETILQSE